LSSLRTDVPTSLIDLDRDPSPRSECTGNGPGPVKCRVFAGLATNTWSVIGTHPGAVVSAAFRGDTCTYAAVPSSMITWTYAGDRTWHQHSVAFSVVIVGN
jgi:hypothetical protein